MRYLLICWTQMGMRFSEPLKCTPNDYNRAEKTITATVKGGKIREYPVTKQLAKILDEIQPTGPEAAETPYYCTLHGRLYNGKPVRWLCDVARREWTKCREQAGIDNSLHIHDLRRTAATNIHRVTGDVLAAQQLLGHEDLATTTHYLKPHEPERMRELIEQLDTRWIQ